MAETEHLLPNAPLQWREDRPCALKFDDGYFSAEGGIAEAHYVFVDQNQLATRWKNLSGDKFFTIGETGFGAGLNFLSAAKLWCEIAPDGGTLHFISAEKYPLRRDDLKRILAAWREQLPLADLLIDNYPAPVPGFHRLSWAGCNIRLTLLFGDATQCFKQLCATDHPLFQDRSRPIDAWFLDGFAPAKNPSMWSPELFATLARLSAENTTFSTFTAAGHVKRGLAEVGFEVHKAPGFGRKRHMLKGSMLARPNATPQKLNAPLVNSPPSPPSPDMATRRRRRVADQTPWYLPAHRYSHPQKPGTAKQAIVVGGGIAGCTSAAVLAQRGWRVTLLERNNALAAEASGNPQAIIYPKLSLQHSPLSRFNLLALLFASRFYQPFWQQSGFGVRSGVIILGETSSQLTVFRQLAALYAGAPELVRYVEGDQLAVVSGLTLGTPGGLLFPALGWIKPSALCNALCAHNNIRVINASVNDLGHAADGWTVVDNQRRTLATAPVVILAAGMATKRYAQTQQLPLKALRGQITLVPATAASTTLRTVLCGKGFAAPAADGWHSIGATYNLDTDSLAVREADHALNLQQLRATDTELGRLLGAAPLDSLRGRAALRCTTPDYLPLLGPAPVYDEFVATYGALARDAHTDIPHCGAYWPGLYIDCGHGSRGMSYAPLGAELLADQIEGLALPLPRDLATALNPARFIIRDLKRHKL